jgi:hypothetical protein
MPIYEVLAHARLEGNDLSAEVQKEFERLPKEQRTLRRWMEIARRKLAERGVPHVYARVHARDAEEARRYAKETLVAAAADQLPRAELPPEEEMFFGPRYLIDTIVYPLAEEVVVDPPPEEPSAPWAPLALAALAALVAVGWLAALTQR